MSNTDMNRIVNEQNYYRNRIVKTVNYYAVRRIVLVVSNCYDVIKVQRLNYYSLARV